MKKCFEYNRGDQPLVISMPHNSALIPDEVASLMTDEAQRSTDTDWFIDQLYDFSTDMGVHTLKPKWSRYYIDLNRDPFGADLYPDANNTELCPSTDFANQALYLSGKKPDNQEIEQRLSQVWKPYHQCVEEVLAAILEEHGYAILFDAHSIASRVPRFFEGRLPDFNFGTAAGLSCDQTLLTRIEALNYYSWTQVSNGRFKGGYITRHYGDPKNNVHAIQLELSQATYLDESRLTLNNEKTAKLKIQLQTIIQTLLDWNP